MDRHGWNSIAERPPTEADGEWLLVWHAYQGPMAVKRVDIRKNRFFSHWKATPEEGWTATAERMPTAEDGDTWKCVLLRHADEGIRVTGWHQAARDRGYTHWMHVPEAPDNYLAIRKSKEDME